MLHVMPPSVREGKGLSCSDVLGFEESAGQMLHIGASCIWVRGRIMLHVMTAWLRLKGNQDFDETAYWVWGIWEKCYICRHLVFFLLELFIVGKQISVGASWVWERGHVQHETSCLVSWKRKTCRK